MKTNCRILRFDPDKDKEPWHELFVLDVEPTETVLGALIKIYQEFDPSLSFRFSCGNMKCGECGVSVNKVSCLACEKLVEPEMTIEPLPNLSVTKDLVVDKRKAIDNIFQLAPLLRNAPDSVRAAREIGSRGLDDYIKMTSCLECVICQSSCPVLKKSSDEFVGPLGLLWLAQLELLDNGKRTAVDSFAEKCTLCGRCWKACPSKVSFLENAIRKLLV